MADLNALPDVSFVETDPSKIEQQVISSYEQVAEVKLYPGDPVRLFLEALAMELALHRQQMDWAAKQNLLAYSTGEYLDHLGALVGTHRLQAAYARTTIRFELEPQTFPVAIPAGVRVSPDSQLMFATVEAAEAAAGAEFVEVEAECQTAGAGGNGFVAGQINKLADPVPYVVQVANTTASMGGADVESDARYRERVHLSPERYSVAGPDGAYVYWAKSAHQDIIDVAVYSPAPGEVEVRPLLKGGEVPGGEILALVEAALDPETVVPLTDSCTVLAPVAHDYTIQATYYVHRDDAALASQIQAAVSTAVEGYVLWQRSKLGRDINPSQLVHVIQGAGAKRVDIVAPAYQALDVWEVANETLVEVVYGGLESL